MPGRPWFLRNQVEAATRDVRENESPKNKLIIVLGWAGLVKRGDNDAMLRDKNLVPLSHQHQHALALCVRIDRTLNHGSGELETWQAEVERQFHDEIRYHFEVEEKYLFPQALLFPELAGLVDELVREHNSLRRAFERARTRTMDSPDLQRFVVALSEHIRKEERQLFEGLQQRLSEEELRMLGTQIEDYFRNSGMPGATCAAPIPRTPE